MLAVCSDWGTEIDGALSSHKTLAKPVTTRSVGAHHDRCYKCFHRQEFTQSARMIKPLASLWPSLSPAASVPQCVPAVTTEHEQYEREKSLGGQADPVTTQSKHLQDGCIRHLKFRVVSCPNLHPSKQQGVGMCRNKLLGAYETLVH